MVSTIYTATERHYEKSDVILTLHASNVRRLIGVISVCEQLYKKCFVNCIFARSPANFTKLSKSRSCASAFELLLGLISSAMIDCSCMR